MSKYNKLEFTTPKFLLCETPVKNDTFHDHRTWIFCPAALSLIEFIPLDDFVDFEFKNNDYFIYTNSDGEDEHWTAQFTQNNCELAGVDEKQILTKAIEVYKEYLDQIDNYND